MDVHGQAANIRWVKIILFSLILFFDGFVEWHQRQPSPLPSPIPLGAIAEVSSAHLQRSLNLGRDLLELSHTFGFADYQREYE